MEEEVLSIVQSGQIQYTVDLPRRQFREVGNPHEQVSFDSDKGRQIRAECGIVWCIECKMAAIISPSLDRKELRCMNCLALIVPRVRL
jgi:hypothetical protein